MNSNADNNCFYMYFVYNKSQKCTMIKEEKVKNLYYKQSYKKNKIKIKILNNLSEYRRHYEIKEMR